MPDPADTLRELLARSRPDAVGPAYARDPAELPAGPLQVWPFWCKAGADWASGNTVSVTPCKSDGTVIAGAAALTGHVTTPTGGNPATGLEPDISQNDVLAYWPWGLGNALLLNVKWQINAAAGSAASGTGCFAADWYDIEAEGSKTIPISEVDWRGRLVVVEYAYEHEPISLPLANTNRKITVLAAAGGAAVTVLHASPLNIGGDTVDMYIDGTDSGKLKIDLVDNGNFGHFVFWAKATDDIEPPPS